LVVGLFLLLVVIGDRGAVAHPARLVWVACGLSRKRHTHQYVEHNRKPEETLRKQKTEVKTGRRPVMEEVL
jgi:hypothetical protein